MKSLIFKNCKGFTLIEILTVIAILTIIFSMTFYFFNAMGRKEALGKDVAGLSSIIRNARLLSVASKDASPFGVHLENNKAILFEGSSYVAGGENEKVVAFNGNVYISSYSLNGGGSDILFTRLTGNTSNYGTITLSLKDGSASTTITVLQTGVIK